MIESQQADLFVCLMRLGQLQKEKVDKVAVHEAVDAITSSMTPAQQVTTVAKILSTKKPTFLSRPDPIKVPALIYTENNRWELVVGLNAHGQWVTHYFDTEKSGWQEYVQDEILASTMVQMSVTPPFVASNSLVYQLIRKEVFSHKSKLFEIILASIIINTVALVIAFYTMQVYDRVVPSGSSTTLTVLSIGVVVAILYEWLSKHFRARLSDRLVNSVDQRLARNVYMRFLSVRLDQMPASVGSLASQMKSYETVRTFLTKITSQAIVDTPFVIIYITLLYAIAGNLAFIPATFFVLSIIIGTYFKKRIDQLTAQIHHAVNFKTGLLVESIEGAETIKSGQGGWRMLSRWMNTTDAARSHEMEMKHISDRSQYMIATFQQFSYISLVASGALLITAGELTMGALIACSILSGRILAPVAAIPQIFAQWSHTKTAIKSLDAVWQLEDDHSGIDQPIVPEKVKGSYRLDQVSATYGNKRALAIPELQIKSGDKIGVLGPVGSGKTTLLRLLSGMYKPAEGRIFMDDMDISHIAKPVLSESMGYLQQEGRLFAGTLRDNLTLGLIDPGDEQVLEVAKMTGLFNAVIATHEEGLQQLISEGGQGLSGGQRQLVNLTRVFLREPRIWLLDEPTASLDSSTEAVLINTFKNKLNAEDTLVIVTHKMEVLNLVDRVIVINNNQLMIDGPKEAVLQRLRQGSSKPAKVEGNV